MRSRPVGGSAAPARLAIQATKAGAGVEAAVLHLDRHQTGCVRPSAGEATDDDAEDSMAFRKADLRPRIPQACPNHRTYAHLDPDRRT